jgi:hypothetical protein
MTAFENGKKCPEIYFVKLPTGYLGYCGNFRAIKVCPTIEEAQVFWAKSIAETIAAGHRGAVVVAKSIHSDGPYVVKSMEDEYYGNAEYRRTHPEDFMTADICCAEKYDDRKAARDCVRHLESHYGYGFLEVMDIDLK